MLVRGHDDMLQKVAEQCLDGAFVPAIDLEIVGDRAALLHVPVGLGQQHTRRIREARTSGFQLLERAQPPGQAGQVVLAGTQLLRQRGVFGTRGGQPCFEHRAFRTRRVERGLNPGRALLGRDPDRRPAARFRP